MNERIKALGVTPGRAAVVAMLSVMLVAVWAPQLSAWLTPRSTASVAQEPRRPSKQRAVDAPSTRRRVSKEVAPAVEQPVVASAAVGQSHRPSYSVDEAAAHDPFALPAWAPRPESQSGRPAAIDSVDAQLDRFESIRRAGVAMIVHSDGGRAAQIGDRVLRVGDRIDGFEVTDITPKGVQFQPAATPESEGLDGE